MTRDEVLDAVYDEVTANDTGIEDSVTSLLEEIVRLRAERDRLRTRVAWLETEVDHKGYLVGAATAYRRSPTPDNRTILFHAIKQYWENSLDDDGTEP